MKNLRRNETPPPSSAIDSAIAWLPPPRRIKWPPSTCLSTLQWFPQPAVIYNASFTSTTTLRSCHPNSAAQASIRLPSAIIRCRFASTRTLRPHALTKSIRTGAGRAHCLAEHRHTKWSWLHVLASSAESNTLGFYETMSWWEQLGVRFTGPGAGRWACNRSGWWQHRVGQAWAARSFGFGFWEPNVFYIKVPTFLFFARFPTFLKISILI
jgi:hypothetical protein